MSGPGAFKVAKSDTDAGAKKPSAPVSAADQAAAFSTQALAKIKELGLPPTPHVYELWFRYFQGDPEIRRAIGAHQGIVDEATCHKFYKRFLSESASGDAVKKISEQVQTALTELTGMMSDAKSATSEYGSTLNNVTQEIQKAETLDDLGRVVSNIVQDTKKMVQKNQDLEFQLTSSSTQVAELKKNLDTVKKEAMTDGLTGLANRKAFDKQIHDWVEDVAVTHNDLCLMMLDIDHFKKFNDSYGHQTGDQVLRLVAKTLIDGVKGRDLAARFGGEEFAIILPETHLEDAMKVAEALRKSVEGKEVINRSSNENLGRITLSAGIAQYVDGESVTDLIGRADAALYEAKKSGRNRVIAAE